MKASTANFLNRKIAFWQAVFLFVSLVLVPHLRSAEDILDSGGPLTPQQAAFDVHFYDLSVQVFPGDSSISGTVTVVATMVHPYDWLVLNLDTVLTIRRVERQEAGGTWVPASYHRKVGEVWIYLGHTRQPGETVQVRVAYQGRPRIAVRPPWNGGFTWARTPSGAPWIATTCQEEGADIWWPVKDHVSDKPDSMAIHVRVPASLFCASNGRLLKTERHSDNTTTYHWFVSTPINTYNVALNIAPYRRFDTTFVNITGDTVPVFFWVLPEYAEHGPAFLKEIVKQLRFFEQTLGPYPFRADKCGVVQTPHLGMEHQTIIAYGAGFDNTVLTQKDWGFDGLLHHEMSHEWWGNLVTNFDWRDMWLHEGFGTYMQALYVEYLHGTSAYHEYMDFLHRFRNELPVAPRQTQTADQIYRAPIYYKGAWVLHTLRYLMGDSLFFRSLRRMAYPTPQLERVTDGRQCRFATTDDYLQLVNGLSGQQLDWFFEMYLRQPHLPQLDVRLKPTELTLRWVLPQPQAFPMPLDVVINNHRQQLVVTPEGITVPLPPNATVAIDPDHWVLFQYKNLEEGQAAIQEKRWKDARQLLTALKGIKNLQPQIAALLHHIRFMETHQQQDLHRLFQRWIGTYRVNRETTLRFLAGEHGFMVLTNRRTIEMVLPIGENQFVERNGRAYYRFESSGDNQIVLIKTDASGRELLRGRRE